VAAQPSAPVAAQSPAAPQIEDQEPARKTDLAAAATTAGRDAETTVARLQVELSTAVRERRDAELAAQAAAAKAGRDAEATTARLQAELSTAIKQKREAELAAKAARTDAEIVRKEFEAAMNDANAAKEEVERLKAGGAAPESNATRAVLIGIAAAAILLFSFWAFPSLRSAFPRPSVHAEKTDAGEGGGEAAAVPSSFASERSAETEPRVDASELLEQLAKTLGVEDAAAQSPAAAAPNADGDRPAVERQDQQAQTQTDTGGDEGSIPSEKPSDVSVVLSPDEDDRELSKSIVPDSPDAPEAEEINEGAALLPNIRLIRR
jgi:predicted DNA-binding protein